MSTRCHVATRKGLFTLDRLTQLSGNAEGSTEWGGAMPYFASV